MSASRLTVVNTGSTDAKLLYEWPLPIPKSSVTKARAKASTLRKRKKKFNGLQLVIAQWQIDRLYAAARCMGIEPRNFLYLTIVGAIKEVEDKFGATVDGLRNLSKSQLADLASKYRQVNLSLTGHARHN
jgi:hypothetical protein